ncbi:YdcF family protein, partial [Patescibacteria group bacterium]|nr:YdcF family protein [Patescibacteria group bacterium]
EANDIIVKPLVRDEPEQPADVIIILGGGVVTHLKILPWGVQERVQRGVELYEAGYADKIILTGGQVKGQTYTESQIMREYIEFFGVDRHDIIEENQARDTHQNASYSHQIMQKHGFERALVVTSDFHSQRACRVFDKQGINNVCIAAFESESFKGNAFRNIMDFRSIIRDYLATFYYLIRGWV